MFKTNATSLGMHSMWRTSLTQYVKRQGRIETIREMLDNEMRKKIIKRWQKIGASVQNKMKGIFKPQGVLQIKFNWNNIQCHDNE